MERGPRYKAYADFRESKLRLRSNANPPPLPPKHHRSTPPETHVKFSANRPKGSSVLAQSVPDFSSVLAQSVPDFSSVLRKENRKPTLPPVAEKSVTPPAKRSSRLYEVNAKLMGSMSSVSSKKSGGLLTERRSYANMDELKKFSVAAANAINGENRGGGRTSVLRSRRYY